MLSGLFPYHRWLGLYGNALSGELPPSIGNCTSLKYALPIPASNVLVNLLLLQGALAHGE